MAESSSGADSDEQEKLSSAVWEPHRSLRKHSVDKKCETQKVAHEEKRSLREHDTDTTDEGYRSLQITPGFRKHVAQKLETFLDSAISESVSKTRRQDLTPCEDEGFLLFSTSNPAATWMMSPPLPKAPVRRWQAGSSDSDSEEENLRLSSVAVDGVQILKESTLLMSGQNDTQVNSNMNTSNSEDRHKDSSIKQKKKRKKTKKNEYNDDNDDDERITGQNDTQVNSNMNTSDSEDKHKDTNNMTSSIKQKKKRKKKKKNEYNDDDSDDLITASSLYPPESFGSQDEKNIQSVNSTEEKEECEEVEEQIKKPKKKKKKEREKNHEDTHNLLNEVDGPENTSSSKINNNISDSNNTGNKSEKEIEQNLVSTKKKKKKKIEN